VADTHIPDRVKSFHPDLLPALRAAQPDFILHAGDVSTARVLDVLREIAPVEMAPGNRDWFVAGKAGWVNHLELGGVRIALMHGHGSWFRYVIDKWFYLRQGYRFERYRPILINASRNARVIVFGHTHHAEMFWIGDQLIFNPGSASFGLGSTVNPGWGILNIYPGGRVEGEIFELRGYRVRKGEWIDIRS
jgi:putative phosphoesterase